MSREDAPLPIHDLSARHYGLIEPIAGHCEAAARVCLDRHHSSPVHINIRAKAVESSATITWEKADDRTRGALNNRIDTTEMGACGCVIAAVELTQGIYTVKAREFAESQKLAHQILSTADLPAFARKQLQVLLQTIWSEEVRQNADSKFTDGAVLVSVAGGDILTGGAPLELVVAKVELLQSIFFRTVEFLQDMPHRKRGRASMDVQKICRPWLFQAAPGSYQFAIAIEDVAQGKLFEQVATAEEIKGAFVALLRDATEDPETALAERVPDKEYRGTFLKLTRALAPTGKDFSVMTIRRDALDPNPITLDANARKGVDDVIRKDFVKPHAKGEIEDILHGTLRAVHLDKDWLEITVNGEPKTVHGVGETVDDEIGHLMNRQVVVRILRQASGKITFVDIEGAP